MTSGYCMKCKERKEMVNEKLKEVITKKGGKRTMIQGKCPICNTTITSFRGAKKKEEMINPKQENKMYDEQLAKDIEDFKNRDRQPFPTIPTQTQNIPNLGTYKSPQQKIEEWNKEARPVHKKIVDSRVDTFIKIFLGILLVGILIFGWAAYNDKFKSDIPSCPNLTCEPCPVNPPCPKNDCVVTCGDCNFPSELDLNLKK